MLKLRLPQSWLLSPTARGLYSAFAVLSLAFWIFVWIMKGVVGPHFVTESTLIAVALRTIVIVGAVTTITLWAAMWYFWRHFDHSGSWRKGAWSLILLLPIGPAIYCFVVYRRSAVFL